MRRVADLKPGDVVTAEPPWTFQAVARVDGPWTWVFTDTGPRRIPSGAILWLDGADLPDAHHSPAAPPFNPRLTPRRRHQPKARLQLSTKAHNQCLRLAHRDGSSACHYCGTDLDLSRAREGIIEITGTLPRWWPTRDHVIPKSAGGRDVDENMVLACQRCNGAKGDMSYDEFVVRRAAQLLHPH